MERMYGATDRNGITDYVPSVAMVKERIAAAEADMTALINTETDRATTVEQGLQDRIDNIELPFTVYNNSEQPSDKWAKLAAVGIDIPMAQFWNHHWIKFNFQMITRAMVSGIDGTARDFSVIGTALCNINIPGGETPDANTRVSYQLGSLEEVPFLNLYCRLVQGAGNYTYEIWLHNKKTQGVDANTTFIKVNGFEAAGTGITSYGMIHVTVYGEQTEDQDESPESSPAWMCPIVNDGGGESYATRTELDNAVAGIRTDTDTRIADLQDQIDILDGTVVASQTWLPAAGSAADLPAVTDTAKTYLCRVISENNVYQCIQGQTSWTLFSENTDYVDEQELDGKAAELETYTDGAVSAHNAAVAPHSAAVSALTIGGQTYSPLAGAAGNKTIALVNDLTTGGASSLLSAEQGKVLKTALDGLIKLVLPVGTVMGFYTALDPNTQYPGTAWVKLGNDVFLRSVTGTPGGTGGANTDTNVVAPSQGIPHRRL